MWSYYSNDREREGGGERKTEWQILNWSIQNQNPFKKIPYAYKETNREIEKMRLRIKVELKNWIDIQRDTFKSLWNEFKIQGGNGMKNVS